MGRMLKGDEASLLIGILIFAFALAFVFIVLGVRYVNFEAHIDQQSEIRMNAIDNLHIVRWCMSRDNNGLVEESKLGGCVSEWPSDFEIGFSHVNNPIHSVYISTTAGELKELYASK